MAPNPLRGALAFLLFAGLAVPAPAVEVSLPKSGGSGSGQGSQAGAVGGLTPGAPGGVSAVPALGLGLAPTLGGAAAPAPLAQPAEAALNPPAGHVGHDPAKPLSWADPDDPTASLAPRKIIVKPAAGKFFAKPLPSAIDAPSHSPASAGEVDANLAAPSGAALKAFYDGAAPRADDDRLGGERADVFAAAAAGRPGLGPAAKSGPKKEFTMAPPAPKSGGAKGWLQNALGTVADAASRAWGGVASAFVKTRLEAQETTITVLPAARWVVTAPGDKLLVRAARGARFEALGYSMLYAPPAAAELKVRKTADQDVSVRLERGRDAKETQALRMRFASFNALIESNFAALELIAQSSSKMTVKTARAVHGHVTAMAEAYAALGENDESRAADALGVKLEVRRLGVQLEAAVRGLSDSDLLPPAAAALVMPIDKRALHKYLNYLHQQALEAVGKSNTASPANLTVRLGAGDAEKAVSLVDLSEHPLVRDGRVVSPGFKALLAAMTRSKDTPKGSLIMQDHQFWGHFKLGAHSAEIYASFLQPDEGGMIRVRYQEWGTGYDNQTRLYYVGRLLHKAGFHVDQKNGFLTAVIDKDHASQTVDEMTDTFALVVQALHATVGVDFALPMLVQGAKTSEEVGRRIDGWVDTVMGEGTLPFYVHDDHNAMVEGWKQYETERRPRAILRAALDRNLALLGLPAIPAEERLGQRTIDRFVNESIEAAIARGQLRLGADGRLVRNAAYDPLASLAEGFVAGIVPGARLAEVVSSLDPSLFRYETIGALGALTVERAQRRLDPNGWVTVYALRDPKGGQIGLARAEIHTLERGERPRPLSPDGLFAALRAQGHPVAKFEPSANPPGSGHFSRLLRAPAPERSAFGRGFQGMAASPGHGRTMLARVTYDKAKAAAGGFIFVAPYTTPDDLDAIRASKAVITTSGGLLSHAAITTREMGIPAAILPGVDWKDGFASLSAFDLGAPVRAGPLMARPARPAPAVALLEGEVVRLDPATGVVEVFPPGASAALLDAAGALERYDASGDSAPLAIWLRQRQATQALRHEQKAILVRELLGGLFSRALGDPRAVKALAHALSVVPGPDDAIGELTQDVLDVRFTAELKEAAAELKERRELIAESLSTESIERLAREAERRAAGLRAVAVELGRRKAELVGYEVGLANLRAGAKERHERLLAEELSDLQTHARLFPAATVEALPRIKAAIAQARRRGMSADLIRKWEDQARRLEDSRRADMESAAPAVLPLAGILDVDVPWVGGKAAKLGEIAAVVRAAGGEVPPGIALTVHAYRRFLREAGIAERLEALGTDQRLTPEQRSEFARRLILGAKLSAQSGVGKEILEGLAAQRLGKVFLAVRSSAVDEDGAEAAFAGAGDTHLYVDPAELLDHVKDVWASLWNPRALLYRQTRGLSTANLAQAVVVQAMVDSVVSGVAFTQDPVSGSSGRVIVNGTFGLGEGVVSGRVAPDQYVLSKKTGLEILPPMVADKKLAVVRGKNGKGTVEEKMPPEWRRRRSMTPAKLKLLSDVSVALERHFGYALDIEFGFDEAGKLYILQSRSVTSNGVEKPAAVPAVPQGSAMKPAAPKAQRLMFVCTGNTCRSPMAAHLAREKLSRHGRPDIEVVSRGLTVAAPGEGMNAAARALLASRGVDASGHQAQALTSAEVAETTLILTMTAAQAQAVAALHPAAKGKVFSLAEYAKRGGDIADPYGGDEGAYLAAATEIGDALDAFVERVPAGDVKEPARP
ncbi:MAG: PEP/pyruvate-binding domain-containing protein [Elusimicrobiota bacterium]|nr:PEP/pyruvate-binding domain-containing protein [Elusimicrobiota bacterium]